MRAAVALACLVTSCGQPAPSRVAENPPSGRFVMYAEGPCSRLSAQARGESTVIVFGETGYDLHGWTGGEPVAAAQGVAEVVGDTVMQRAALTRGLPHDARGYVPGTLDLGDDWLVRTTTRYASGGTGALFEKETMGYRWSGHNWVAQPGSTVTRPAEAGGLGPLPAICADDESFVPIAHDASPEGGVFIAGRCDDAAAPNPLDPVVFVAHGRPGARAWRIARVPETDELRGIVNLDLHARHDDEAYLVAYEPFVAREERKAFLAGYDGRAWRRIEVAVADGLMSVAGTAEHLYLAGGRRLYRRDYGTATLSLEVVALPQPRFARVSPEQMHVHHVERIGRRVWVEASYRVVEPQEGGHTIWASALYSTEAPRRLIHCDAREPARGALAEVPE